MQLPTGFYGLLHWVGEQTGAKIVATNGTYNVGVLRPGFYNFVLELLVTGEFDVSRPEGSPPAFHGMKEYCTLQVVEFEQPVPDPVPDPIPDPVDPPDPVPPYNINVSINLVDGAIVVNVYGIDPSCPLDIVLMKDWAVIEEYRNIIDKGIDIIFVDLEPGHYQVVVYDCNGVLYGTGHFSIEDNTVEPAVVDDPVLPHAWGLHKILVCKDGKNMLVPYHVADRWVRVGKATLGGCK